MFMEQIYRGWLDVYERSFVNTALIYIIHPEMYRPIDDYAVRQYDNVYERAFVNVNLDVRHSLVMARVHERAFVNIESAEREDGSSSNDIGEFTNVRS